MNVSRFFVLLLLGATFVGCDSGPKSGRGFTLPDGDSERGKTAFQQFRCHDCHSVTGVELPPPEEPDHPVVNIGGKVTRIKTYGELVTSIINPSHRLARGYSDPQGETKEGESPMKNYNAVMTVDHLIDIVAFLQSRYELYEYEPTKYAPYY